MFRPSIALLAAALVGCSFTAEDIDTWDRVANGNGKLAAYYADSARPEALRLRAAGHLYSKGDLAALVGVVKAAKGPLQAERAGELAKLATADLAGDDPKAQARGAELAFHVLAYHANLAPALMTPLVEACLDWALAWTGRDYPGERRRPPEDVFLAVAVAAPDKARAAGLTFLQEAAQDEAVKAMATTLARLRDPALQAKVAAALLERARKVHPKITAPLLDAMLSNGNETLLKYVLAIGADPRVPQGLRGLAMDVADQRLKKKGLPVYQTMLSLDEPATGDEIRYVALDRVLEYGGAEALKPALLALNPDGHWPSQGEELKAEIRKTCDERVAGMKVAARPVLLELLDANSWIARAYALECVIRLYPDEAPELLIDLLEDETPLKGWTVDGSPTTFGAVVRALREG